MAEQRKCTLTGCSWSGHSGTGLAAHQRGHVLRGEATWADADKSQLTATGVPVVTEPYERKKRMDAIKSGALHAEARMPSKTKALAKQPPAPTETVTIPSLDISRLTPNQIAELQAKLGMVQSVEGHSCPTTRASDRLKEAVVLMSVSEMLDEMPADQVLLMLENMKRLPSLPRR